MHIAQEVLLQILNVSGYLRPYIRHVTEATIILHNLPHKHPSTCCQINQHTAGYHLVWNESLNALIHTYIKHLYMCDFITYDLFDGYFLMFTKVYWFFIRTM